MLTLEAVDAGYGELQVLHGVDMEIGAGEVVALIGANGAGKTTTLRAIAGILQPTRGRIMFDGKPTADVGAHQLVRRGMSMVAEDRELFGGLSVAENLRMGAFTRKDGQIDDSLREVYELFPILEDRRGQRADTMSGGQQQMLAIGRALMAKPRLLLLDEPSLGLAPKLVEDVFGVVERISDAGITVLIVEQNAQRTLEIADRAYVIESGEITLSGPADDLLGNAGVRRAYLGM